nr:MAG TPA: hypothetical protein [Caudoviricetes sp.]
MRQQPGKKTAFFLAQSETTTQAVCPLWRT